MNCCVTELRCKEVINSANGCRIGQVCDVEIDSCSGSVVSLIIWGRPRGFGLFGREGDIRICWKDIEVIGEDTVLVCAEGIGAARPPRERKSIFEGIFR